MANTQAILSALTNMQANIQGELPVIPNNGNPGGAHNMPHMAQQEQVQAPPDPYAWLKPSPFMDTAKQLLDSMSAVNQQRAATYQPVQSIPEPPSVMPTPPVQTQPMQLPQGPVSYYDAPVLPQWVR